MSRTGQSKRFCLDVSSLALVSEVVVWTISHPSAKAQP